MGIVVSNQLPKTAESLSSDWEDVAVRCAFIAKAVYYAGVEREKAVVTHTDILEWLEKYHYHVNEKDMIRKTLLVLSSTGVVTRHGSDPQMEGWEWQLK